ncbi:MAG: hypothetical protein IJL56_08605 [Bacteroidales bacterium]|nr:hypothetical protein [Bacteroidales bacterium]
MKPITKYWPLAVAVILYVLYACTGIYWFRWSIIAFLLVFVLQLILRKAPEGSLRKYLFVPLAFAFSIVGDMFLYYDQGRAPLFIAGVAFYFIAHIFYICYTLRKGRVNGILLSVLTVIFLAYFIWMLVPSISNNGIRIAVLLYILISCLSVSCAAAMPYGPTMDKTAKILVITGISSLLFSDFLISLHDFMGIQTGYAMMLPTFYLSQILVSAAVIHLLSDRK